LSRSPDQNLSPGTFLALSQFSSGSGRRVRVDAPAKNSQGLRLFATTNPATVCFLFDTVLLSIRLGRFAASYTHIPYQILRKSSTDKKRVAADVSRLAGTSLRPARIGFADELHARRSAPPLQSSYGFRAPPLPRRISHWIEGLLRFESSAPQRSQRRNTGERWR